MILITRGKEPPSLADVRNDELPKLRLLKWPKSDQISNKYKVVAESLWTAQHFKCCYCEKVIECKFNDLEHYRPKSSACRSPGCPSTHGYWWLAYTWSNLLFACPNCNRTGKNDQFPLDIGSVSLAPELAAPGNEYALLLDPGGSDNPVEHILYSYQSMVPGGPNHWWATPRGGSQRGHHTITVCDLNRGELRELRQTYFANVIQPQVDALHDELADQNQAGVRKQFARAVKMFSKENTFAAFTYDALCACVLNDDLQRSAGVTWPRPEEICLP